MGITVSGNEQIFCPRCQSDDVFSRRETCICGNCGFRFQHPGEEIPFHPLKLFLSYGHKEVKICRLINQALKDRGHATWFDEDKLCQGLDWRKEITDGIKESNGVISCLSRHSVRDPGVCLNELSIAIGVRGGNIKTILLEPERDVRPPASLCHIQWLDMSDWRNWYNQGEDIFRPWFGAKMAQLFQVIESDESREFTGQITAIQEKLHINYDTGKQRDLLRHLFVGREWLTEQLERWLDDLEGPRMCILYGDPGVGKSAFAANYIHYNPRVAAGLFCEYDRPIYNDASTVIMTLSYLLACRLPSYRTVLVAVLEREKRLGMMNASELFDLLLADPLATLTIDGDHETLCIVIDGLDECGRGEYNALAEVLARYVPRLPVWLRMLATSREVTAVKTPLVGTFELELHGDSPQNQADVRQYFIERLEESQGSDSAWDHALVTLTERSGGIFLYAQLVCEGILAGKLSIHDTGRFPDGLSNAFYQWFGWFFPDDREYKADFRLPLGMFLAVREPLPTEEFKRIFEWDNNRLGDFLRRVEVLLRQDVNDFGKKTVTFTHLYLSEWLGTEQVGCFRSDRTAALERMAGRFYALFQKDVKSLTEYESLHLAGLLKQNGNTVALEEVILNHDLLWNIIHAGDHCETWGKLPTALACYEQACAMAEQRAAQRNEFRDRRDLSASYSRIAGIVCAQGDLTRALELHQKSLEIAEHLVQERNTPESRRDLSIRYGSLADVLWDKDEPIEALKLFGKSKKIAEQLVQERGTPGDLRAMIVSYVGFAKVLDTMGNLDFARARAQKLYQKGLEIAEQLARERDTPESRSDLNVMYNKVAGFLQDKGDLDGALELYKKSLEITEQLVQERGMPNDRVGLTINYNSVAYILQARGNLSKALELYQKGMKLGEQLVKERGTPEDRRILRVSYNNASKILQVKGDLSGALRLYQKSRELAEQLVQERGTTSDCFNLAVSYYNLSTLTVLPDAERLIYSKQGLELSEQLLNSTGLNLFQDFCKKFHQLIYAFQQYSG